MPDPTEPKCVTCCWYEPRDPDLAICFIDPPVPVEVGWDRPRVYPYDRCSRWEQRRAWPPEAPDA